MLRPSDIDNMTSKGTEMNRLGYSGRVAVLMGGDRWNENQVVTSLQAAGLEVERLASGLALLARMQRQHADVVVVEDHGDELAACLAALRFRGLAGIPVIAVGRGSMEQIVRALGHGASDYLCLADLAEPLVYRVLARIALSRRRTERATLQLGDLVLDASSRALRCPGGEQSLTAREFELTWVLFEHAGEVVNLQSLAQRVWGRDASLAKRTIEQHISRVRQKLARAAASVGALVQLQAIHNIGYRLTHSCALRALVPSEVRALPGVR